jgi:lipopolysaccharide transport system permease protein
MTRVWTAQTKRNLIWRPLWKFPQHWNLLTTLARRELAARYRGSMLGLIWVVLTPLVMIAIYTFIFAEIFGARFGANGTSLEYALYLFCGLLPWTAFQDALQSSANTILAHSNLVKRVRFPLETLPVAQVLVALANQMFGTVALLLAALLIRGQLHLTLLWLPVLLVPQLILTTGLAWFIASLGVFLRDTAQTLSLVLIAWLYLTPIIYPEAAVPARYHYLINANPFTALIRNYRDIMLEGRGPDWMGLSFFLLFGLVIFPLGYWWFARTRRSFADVL